MEAERFPTTIRNLASMENQSHIKRWKNGASPPLESGFDMSIRVIVD
ncbi:hypothetical protein KBY25_19175 [Ruegeria pomeroyi]|nr:hypothetical protein [Ruegeria pomeroyi]